MDLPTNDQDLILAFRRALDARDRRGVNDTARAMIARNMPLGATWKTIATVLMHNGEYRTATEAMNRYVTAQGGTPAAKLEQLFQLERAGQIDAARAALDRIPAPLPNSGDRAYIAGTLDTMLGHQERALDELSAAVAAKPGNGRSWLALAMVGDMAAQPELADRIVAADPARTGKPVEPLGSYYYALGKVHADRGDRRKALEAFQRGAALIAQTVTYDRHAEEEGVRQIVAGFDRKLVDRLGAGIDRDTSRPIIVTGNPRSGTTLAAQILNGHSNVTGGDELGLMRVIAEETGGLLPVQLNSWLTANGRGDVLAELYLHLVDQRFDGAGRIVDKTLGASRTLGLLAAALPDAPLVWMRRDPFDNAWSCFRTHFDGGNDWSWSFETIAHHFNLEKLLLTHWVNVLGDRLLVIDYAELATDPYRVIPSLLAHCSLPLEDAVFTPETATGAVRTASVMQIREPISPRGIGVSAPYREAMGAFVEHYLS